MYIERKFSYCIFSGPVGNVHYKLGSRECECVILACALHIRGAAVDCCAGRQLVLRVGKIQTVTPLGPSLFQMITTVFAQLELTQLERTFESVTGPTSNDQRHLRPIK